MDSNINSGLNKPVSEEKTKDSEKIADFELILLRRRQNAARVRACRERKKALGESIIFIDLVHSPKFFRLPLACRITG